MHFEYQKDNRITITTANPNPRAVRSETVSAVREQQKQDFSQNEESGLTFTEKLWSRQFCDELKKNALIFASRRQFFLRRKERYDKSDFK